MASTYLSRNISAGSTGKKFTLSAWIKFTSLSTNSELWSISNDNTVHNYIDICFKSGVLDMQFKLANGGTFMRRKTTRLFRDVNAWYHIVLRFDSTNSTASDRFRLYVNGVQETSFDNDGTASTFSSDYVTALSTSGANQFIGRTVGYSSYWDGSMSHFHLCDGYSYAPTVFGSTDSTTGEWKINTSPSITMGTNGFTILKDGNTITDQSSNSNDFSLGAGTLTKTEDNPSNVFATLNPLDNYYANATFSNGNTKITTGTSREASVTATIPMFKGKYYWEAKTLSSSAPFLGIQPIPSFGNTASPAPLQLNGYGLLSTGKVETTNGSGGSIVLATYATYTAGDIIGIAVDLDSAQNKIYFYKNGTLLGASGVNITSVGSTSQGMYLAAFGVIAGQDTIEVNFGNGYFGTTAVSSAGTNASGIGIFEYDVPTGYTALSTKGLNL